MPAIAATFGLIAIGILVVGGEPLIAFLFKAKSAQFLPVYPVLMVMIARIYVQLAGAGTAEVGVPTTGS